MQVSGSAWKKVLSLLVAAVIVTGCGYMGTSGSQGIIFGSGNNPRNVILIIPDGTSSVLWTAIRSMTVGPGGELNVDKLAEHGYCHTYSADSFITDSAASGTAYSTGQKTNNGVIAMDASTTRGDSLTGRSLTTILELAKEAGYATGVVTTDAIYGATPAAFYAHAADRNWGQLIVNQLAASDIDVIMGGGRELLLPAGATGEEGARARRDDQRNIIAEMRAKGYTYAYNQTGFDAVDPASTDRLLGIFNPGSMQYEYDRLSDKAGEPGLWEMTDKAIRILSKSRDGFFLMVEAADIDHAGHSHLTHEWLWDGIACDKAVGVALDFAREHDNTLVIVVPDHSTGGPYLVGTLQSPDSDRISGSAFPSYRLDSEGFPIKNEGRPVAIQWIERTDHTGEDVGIHSTGPGSENFAGVINNIDVCPVMKAHLRVGDMVQGPRVKTLEEIVDP